MTIRRATRRDIETILQMQLQLQAEEAIRGYGPDTRPEWAGRDLELTFLAEDDDGRACGFIYGCDRPRKGECVFPDTARVAEIVELYVAPEARHAGLGKKLVDAFRQAAQEMGYTHLRLYSAARRFDDIVAFYRGCGFDPWYLEMTMDLGQQGGATGGQARPTDR